MPFKKVKYKGRTMYRSPSGRRYTKKQVRLYYATSGFRPSKMRRMTRLKRRRTTTRTRRRRR